MLAQSVGGSEFAAVVGTFGGGTERRVCVWGYRRLVRALVLRTLLYLAVVLPLLCHTRLDRVSGFVSLVVGMVSPKCYCAGDLGWY